MKNIHLKIYVFHDCIIFNGCYDLKFLSACSYSHHLRAALYKKKGIWTKVGYTLSGPDLASSLILICGQYIIIITVFENVIIKAKEYL